MNGRAIPGAYLFPLYVCDKEMSWPHHIGETHQPDGVVYVRDSEKFRLTNVIPERIIFVSRGITVLSSRLPANGWEVTRHTRSAIQFRCFVEWTSQLKQLSDTRSVTEHYRQYGRSQAFFVLSYANCFCACGKSEIRDSCCRIHFNRCC